MRAYPQPSEVPLLHISSTLTTWYTIVGQRFNCGAAGAGFTLQQHTPWSYSIHDARVPLQAGVVLCGLAVFVCQCRIGFWAPEQFAVSFVCRSVMVLSSQNGCTFSQVWNVHIELLPESRPWVLEEMSCREAGFLVDHSVVVGFTIELRDLSMPRTSLIFSSSSVSLTRCASRTWTSLVRSSTTLSCWLWRRMISSRRMFLSCGIIGMIRFWAWNEMECVRQNSIALDKACEECSVLC